MKNTTSTRKKSIFLKKIGMLAVFSPIFLSLFSACADTEPIDEDETDPSINPPITFVDDDEDTSGIKKDLTFPNFKFGTDSLAFPYAEGFGRKTKGARAASDKMKLYRVTNLNASGAGSFKDAISEPNRIIVFGVAGVIDMNKGEYVLQKNQTILFETAPGDGIELYNGRISSSGASELIVRFMRVRMGRQVNGKDSGDAGGCANGENQIYDHCSFTWGLDECFSLSRDGKGVGLRNITLSNSIVGQGCMNHSCGGLIQTDDEKDEGITIFRNLLIDNKSRNFKTKGLNQYINNVLYNWGNGSAYDLGGESGAGLSHASIVNNYFIAGPSKIWINMGESAIDPDILADETICSPSGDGYYEVLTQPNHSKPISTSGGIGDFYAYCTGNFYDGDKDGTLNGVEITWSNWDSYCSSMPKVLSSPDSRLPEIPNQTSALEAYNYVVEKIGAYLPNRDHVDGYLVEELTSLGTKGTIIRDQRKELQYPLANTWQNINTTNNIIDTDGDGMPDEFEDKWGLNKRNPDDAVEIASNGYTNIENYAFSLEFPDVYEKQYQKWLKQ